MGFLETRDERAGAQGTILFPLHPEPDGVAFSKADMQMMVGVYPGFTFIFWRNRTDDSDVTWQNRDDSNTIIWSNRADSNSITWENV